MTESDTDGLITVHSVQEEYFYMMVHPCECGGPWFSTDDTIRHFDHRILHHRTVRCAKCGKEEGLRFELPDTEEVERPAPVREINPTDEPSQAIDVAEWIDLANFYVGRIERIEDPVEKAQSLLDARGCLEEALKLYGPGDDAPPESALWSDASRRKVKKDPDAYRRARIEERLAAMPSREALEKVDVAVQRQFEQGLKAKAREKVGRWWQFWKR